MMLFFPFPNKNTKQNIHFYHLLQLNIISKIKWYKKKIPRLETQTEKQALYAGSLGLPELHH